MNDLTSVRLGRSDLFASPVCLGTMTFGEQVDEATAHDILDRAVERGVNFIDTAELYAVPTKAETYTLTEQIIGRWLAKKGEDVRSSLVIGTKVAGPSRGMSWVRGGSADLTGADIVAACEASLRRLQTDVIDLYQLHWPTRYTPLFGSMYFDPSKVRPTTTMEEQLRALGSLVDRGLVRAVGLSNETPYGLHEFVHLAEQHGLPRVATVQNPYALTHRGVDNGLDESLHHLGVSLLAYSPLSFGALTGKYDGSGWIGPGAPDGRMSRFDSSRQQRWGRVETLTAARRYNAIARAHGLTPTQMALAFCYTNWRVSSTIIGVTTLAQLDENLNAWGTTLSPDVLAQIDAVRWDVRDPAW